MDTRDVLLRNERFVGIILEKNCHNCGTIEVPFGAIFDRLLSLVPLE